MLLCSLYSGLVTVHQVFIYTEKHNIETQINQSSAIALYSII